MAVAALVALGRPVHQPRRLHAPRRSRSSPPSTASTGPPCAVRADPGRGDRCHRGATAHAARRVPRRGQLRRGRAMDELGAAHDGWVNLHPQVRPEDEPPPRTGLSTLLLAGAGPRHPGVHLGGGEAHRAMACSRTRSACSTPRAPGCWPGWPRPGLALPDGWASRPGPSPPRPGREPGRPAPTTAPSCRGSSRRAPILSAVRLTGEWQAEVHLPA